MDQKRKRSGFRRFFLLRKHSGFCARDETQETEPEGRSPSQNSLFLFFNFFTVQPAKKETSFPALSVYIGTIPIPCQMLPQNFRASVSERFIIRKDEKSLKAGLQAF